MKKGIFFKRLIKKFKKKKIEYVFLRGQEFLANKENYGEVDILVKKSDLAKVKKLFKNIEHSYQIKNNIDLTHPFLVRVVRKDFIMDLDFQIKGIGYCGDPILKEDYLFKMRVKKEDFFELNKEAKFLMLFIHGFIFKKKIDYFKKYEKEFFRLYMRIDKDRISKELTRMFSKGVSKKIVCLIEKEALNELFKLRSRLIRIHLTKNPLEIYKVLISKLMRFRNYFHLDRFFYTINLFKWAPLISFIGPDGSGKTTMVHEFREYLKKFEIRNVSISGGVFSGIKIPFKKEEITKEYSERVNDPKEKGIKLLTRILLQIPKQIKIAYYRKIGTFVITDRYSYDLILFYDATRIFKHLTKIISQKPTKCFYLNVSPSNIHKRNKELNINAIKKIMNRASLNKDYLNLIEIKNNNHKKSKGGLEKHLSEIIKNV